MASKSPALTRAALKRCEVAPGVSRLRAIMCHVAAATISLGIITPVTLMLTDNRTCQITKDGVMTPNEGVPGAPLTFEWSAMSLIPCEGTVTIRVIDKAGTIYETESVPAVTKSEQGVWRRYSKTVVVPSAVPGPATYDPLAVRWRWRIQWLWPTRERPHEAKPVTFTILSPLRGLTGATGAAGPAGVQGQQGDQGERGKQGEAGQNR